MTKRLATRDYRVEIDIRGCSEEAWERWCHGDTPSWASSGGADDTTEVWRVEARSPSEAKDRVERFVARVNAPFSVRAVECWVGRAQR